MHNKEKHILKIISPSNYQKKKKTLYFLLHQNLKEKKKKKEHGPVTIAVRPVPSTPWVTSSAVEEDENPDGPFLLKGHILSQSVCVSGYVSLSLSLSPSSVDNNNFESLTHTARLLGYKKDVSETVALKWQM